MSDRTVWKHNLTLMAVNQSFSVPTGSKVVHVDLQHDMPTVWFEVSGSVNTWETVEFFIVGTGHPVPDHSTHRGTVLLEDGHLVLHIYEADRRG